MSKVCFVIAHKFIRGYPSLLKFYIDNIQWLYPDALTIVVDNNSTYVEDVFGPLRSLPNVVFLTNDISCKFEVGAYRVGLKYILDNGLDKQYDHFVFSQENFVLRNYFDFNQLVEKKTWALPINNMRKGGDHHYRDLYKDVLTKMGLPIDLVDKADFVWCHSFIVANHKLVELASYLKNIVITTRHDSEVSERWLAAVLYMLNEYKDCGSIDGSCLDLPQRHYDCWDPNVYRPVTSIFRKRVMQRSESTRDAGE